jgi:hypothetical protein
MPDRGVPIGDPVNTAAHVATPQWQSFETRMRHRRANRCLQRAAAAIESGQLAEATEALDEARELNPRAPELDSLLDRLAIRQASPAAPLVLEPSAPFVVPEPDAFAVYAPESGQEAHAIAEPELPEFVPPDVNEVDDTVVPAFARMKPPRQLDLDEVEPADLHPLHAREPVDLHPLHPPEQLSQPMLAQAESRSPLRAIAVGCVAIGLSAFAGWLAVTQWPARVPASEQRSDITLPPVGRESIPPEAVPSAVREEPAGTDVTLESGNADQSPVTSEPDTSADAAATAAALRPPRPESEAPSPESTVPRREVESTTGTVSAPVAPTPAAPPSSAQLVPRVVDDAPPAAPRTIAADSPTAPATGAPAAGATSLPAPPTAALPEPGPLPASESPPPPVAPEAPPRAAPAAVDDRAAVRATLARYAAAYTDLDIAGARAVWPGVDQRALARAFEGLASQRVALGTCEVGVNGPSARAICVGNATWTPKVGGGRQTKSRTWTFDLRRADSAWQIVKVDTR